MDPPTQKSKPISALPSHMQNGSLHHTQQSSPLRSSKTSVNAKERERLTASIKSSSGHRQPLALNSDSNELSESDQHGAEAQEAENHDEAQPDSTAGIPTSRPASPYTSNPPIDFDGLSWPSKHCLHYS